MYSPYRYPVASLMMVAAIQSSAQSANPDEEELALTYGDKPTVSIATGSKQDLARAPAVATVITAQDIAAMGATDLDQALESVAGMHVSSRYSPLNPLYMIRGIATTYNPHVLMLVNGVPITSSFVGGRGEGWGGMPLENVARIEVIRGPGSALYGADALSGVINIITKNAADVSGLEAGVRIGSKRYRDGFIQYGGTLGPVQAALYLRAGSTDGHDGIVERDLQTLLDGLFGTRASLAPGPINAARDALDLRTDLALDAWRLRAGYQQRKMGMGLGLSEALDPRGTVRETRVYVDLSYTRENWLPNWDVMAIAGTNVIRNAPGKIDYLLFPPGAFGGAFPEGVIGNPGHSERHHNLNVSGVYTGLQNHRVRIGAGYRKEDMYKTAEFKNFDFVVVPGIGPALLPLPGRIDASNDPGKVFLLPQARSVGYVFAQDEWTLAKDWTLTAGVRHDDYSDFGGTTNPRLALVWDARYDLIVKAMHGRAFRAPAFTEQFARNNPVAAGNPLIRPETLAMSELAVSWDASATIQANVSLFRYRMDDVISATPNADPATGKTYRNAGAQTGHGMEAELTWDASRSLRMAGSYSFQDSTDRLSDKAVGLAPRHRLFGRMDWRFARAWQVGATLNHVAGRERQAGDARRPIEDFTAIDLTVRHQMINNGWEFRASVTNLFNADVREPTFAPGNIPNDMPMPKRAFSVQLVYQR